MRTTESLFLGAVKSMAEVLPPASSSQDAAIAEAAAAIRLGVSKLGDLGADPWTILLHALRHMWLSSTEFHWSPNRRQRLQRL